MSAPLLIEMGCEEIPARMIPGAAADLAARVLEILDAASLAHGPATCWGGSRRLAVRVEAVAARQADRVEQVVGPPAKAAFANDGSPTPALIGFARKQGIDVTLLAPVETDRGSYAGFRRTVPGKPLEEVLQGTFPRAVGGMSFPKTMRWATGEHRWVRPVHWLLALHGEQPLPLRLFDVVGGPYSRGHRFLSRGNVMVNHPDQYVEALKSASVFVDPEERKTTIRRALQEQLRQWAISSAFPPEELEVIPDEALVEELSNILEWPSVVVGTFDSTFSLELPREIIITTLRHHQKSFAVSKATGRRELWNTFLCGSNLPSDPGGHVRRGNEWVVRGRLEDALFFWRSDVGRSLRARAKELESITYHRKIGSYATYVGRLERVASELGRRLGIPANVQDKLRDTAQFAKIDLVTNLVGEFPELQGVAGGLLLEAEGVDKDISQAVYEHYRPVVAGGELPKTLVGSVTALADRLATIGALFDVGEEPTGSRDPFGLRRAGNGVIRLVNEWQWPLSLEDLASLTGGSDQVRNFFLERLQSHWLENGASTGEIRAVLRARVSPTEALQWGLGDIAKRLMAIRMARSREDFTSLISLTKRVDNIIRKGPDFLSAIGAHGATRKTPASESFRQLDAFVEAQSSIVQRLEGEGQFGGVVDAVGKFVAPVGRFFEEVLVLDAEDWWATSENLELLGRVRSVVTRCFDVRELSGEASAPIPVET